MAAMRLRALLLVALLAATVPVTLAPRSAEAAGSLQSYVTGLNVPIALAFTSDGRVFFAERNTGSIRVIVNGSLQGAPYYTLAGTAPGGGGGLLGLAPRPRARPRLPRRSVRLRVPDVQRRRERDDLQPRRPDHGERDRDVAQHDRAVPARGGVEPQRRRDRLRPGREAVRRDRGGREPGAVTGPDEPEGEGPPDQRGRGRPDGQPVLRQLDRGQPDLHVRAPEHVRPHVPP